jgi:hypothetical protein
VLWGPIVGPIVSIVSFVCSIGNVPLAAVLFAATHPSRATALVVLEGFAHPLALNALRIPHHPSNPSPCGEQGRCIMS